MVYCNMVLQLRILIGEIFMRNFKNKERSRGDIVAAADDKFKSQNYAEYIVDVKKEGKYKRQRTLMILAYVLFVGMFFGITFAFNFPWIIFLAFPLTMILYYATWHYFSRSFCYVIETGVMNVTKVYGYKKEDDYVKFRISEAEMIAPFNDEYKHYAHAHADAVEYAAVSSFSASDIYFATFTQENGTPAVLFFEATEQVLKALRYYNSKATVMTKTIH